MLKKNMISVGEIFLLPLLVGMFLAGCGEKEEDFTPIGLRQEEEEAGSSTASDQLFEDGAFQTPVTMIYVHVCGAVEIPGVAALPENSRVNDAIEAAGGFTADACRDYLNLAAKIADGQRIYVPTEDEISSQGGVFDKSSSTGVNGTGLVNINTADEKELCTLPGIGETRAKAIISYRNRNGPFKKCEDIKKVSGIKDSLYADIKELLTVN